MAKPSASQEILLEEWKEARSSIGRFDEYLLNLRRYGFTLTTILIGADAYISMSIIVHPGAKAGAAAAVMLLIVALFLLDHHVKILQYIVLERATAIEDQLGLGLSKLRQGITRYWQITHGGTPTYVLFLFVTGVLGSTSVLTTALPAEPVSLILYKWVPLVLVAVMCLILCVLTTTYDWWTTRKMEDLVTPAGVKRQLAGAFTRLGQTLRKKDKQT